MPKTKNPPRHGEAIPPDVLQCQAEKPDPHAAFRLGGRPGVLERCENEPTYIIVETTVSKDDGLYGSMSLCIDCYEVFKKQCPDRKVKLWKRTATDTDS